MRLLLYTGKGGVGKTTTAAATAALAAERGLRTLIVSADAAHSLGDVFDAPVGAEPVQLGEGLDALEVDVRVEVGRHWGRVQEYLVELFRHQGIEEVVAEELALLPGAEELTTLVAVDEWARSGGYDLVVVDCAPTGSALRLVTLPEMAHGSLRWLLKLQRAASSVIEPIAGGLFGMPLPGPGVFAEAERLLYKTLKQLRARLLAEETSVRLVVTPERMVIDEARRAYTDLCLFQVECDAVVMNRWLPDEALEEPFFEDWGAVQARRFEEVVEAFAPLPVLRSPLASDEVRGRAALAAHGAMIFAEHDPVARLARPARLRFVREGGGYELRLPLPGVEPHALEVVRVEEDLVVGTKARRRSIRLPPRLAGMDVRAARLADGELVVRFDREGDRQGEGEDAGPDAGRT